MLKISAVLIVRNEAHHLHHCLSALRQVVDEIIVADTGSDDNTIQAALAYTATVVEIPWHNDFSRARNTAITHATGDWILVVDADEVVENPDAARQRLQQFAQNSNSIGTVHVQSATQQDGEPCISNSHIKRFFPRIGFSFHGRIHEQVESDLTPVASAPTGVKVAHSGYQHDSHDANHKARRNIPLLQQAVIERPDDEYLHFQLGRSWFTLSDYNQSIPSLKTALQLIDFRDPTKPLGVKGPVSREVLTNSIVSLAYAYINIGELDLADSLLVHHQSMNHIGTQWADFAHVCGYLAFVGGNVDSAVVHYKKSMTYGPGCEDVEGCGSYSSAYHLGLLAEVQQDLQTALACYARAFEYKPDYRPAVERCIDCAMENDVKLTDTLTVLIKQDLFHEVCLDKKYRRHTHITDSVDGKSDATVTPFPSPQSKTPLITIKQAKTATSLS